MKKNVNLKITNTQYSENLRPSGETFLRELEKEDTIEILTEGTLYLKNNAMYITYEDLEEPGLGDSTTLLKLMDGSVRIRRFSSSDTDEGMDMTLVPGLRNITRYKLPMASLDLEVYTNKIEDNLDREGYGTVCVDFKIKFDQILSRRHILEIEVMPS